MKRALFSILAVTIFCVSAFSQIPASVRLQILKAEDARWYNDTLEALLKSSNESVRVRAALAAGRIGVETAIPALTELLDKDPSSKVREMAAFALGEIESISAADAVLNALRSQAETRPVGNVSSVTARLVEAAGKIAAANSKNPKAAELGKAIVKTLDSSTDALTTRLALTAVLRARPAGSEEVVRKSLARTDPAIVSDALNTLARLRAKNANRDARDLLQTNVHAIVRANAARVLGAAEDKDAIDILIKAATTDADSRVRVAAIRSLVALKDAKAADPLLKRGEVLFAAYKAAKKPNFIPDVQNEFIEIATTLGRLLMYTGNERAVNLFREFGKLDQGFATDVYIARIRISPGPGDNNQPEMTSWRQNSTLAQVVGEFATLEPTTDEAKQMKIEAPVHLGILAKAFAEADPVHDAATIKAGPDVLRAFAGFKTQNLSEVLRAALNNKDVFIRATAAELLADQPVSQENLDALNKALDYAIGNDMKYNDSVLATIDALFKLDKWKSLPALIRASKSPDRIVLNKLTQLLKDEVFKNLATQPGTKVEQAVAQSQLAILRASDAQYFRELPLAGKGTKLGQVLNTDTDYRRALSRKNGSVRAILTTTKGTFTIEFLPEDAPLTVDNFIKLARSNYFNGLELHRVVPNFVMQDGDPRGDGNGGPGWSIRCEINMVPYDRGAVGMALSGKDTGGSQWFVTHSPQPHLDGGYTVFGRVNETGMKVVDRIVRGDKIINVRIVGR